MARRDAVLIATESLGPVNGVTRATERLLNYLEAQEIAMAVAPEWRGGTADAYPERVRCQRLRGWPLPYNPELLMSRSTANSCSRREVPA